MQPHQSHCSCRPPLLGRLSQPAGADGATFGETMGLPTAHELRNTIESAGWQIKSWSDVRPGTEGTQYGYRRRLEGVGAAIRADGDTQLSLLKRLTHDANGTATWQVRCRSINVPADQPRPVVPVCALHRPATTPLNPS